MKLDILLDTRKNMPLSLQFAEGIKVLIAQRTLTFGYVFENPSVIALDFSVPLQVIEEAFGVLEKEGFVSTFKDTYQLTPLLLTQTFYFKIQSLYEAIRSSGYDATFQTIEIKDVKTLPDQWASYEPEALGYVYVLRVYFANKTPMSVLEAYYPKKYVDGSIHTYKDVLFHDMFKKKGITLAKAKRRIDATYIHERIAEHIHHPTSVPVLTFKTETKDLKGHIIEYALSYQSMNYTMYLKETIQNDMKHK